MSLLRTSRYFSPLSLRSSVNRTKGDSIVSVVLSLGLHDASRRRSGRNPVRVTVCRVAVSNTLFHDGLLHQGCSDFPPLHSGKPRRGVTVLYPQRCAKYSRNRRKMEAAAEQGDARRRCASWLVAEDSVEATPEDCAGTGHRGRRIRPDLAEAAAACASPLRCRYAAALAVAYAAEAGRASGDGVAVPGDHHGGCVDSGKTGDQRGCRARTFSRKER